MNYMELIRKQVINERDCRMLGFVCDIQFDECNGLINALIVPGPAKYMKLFGRDNNYVIPFRDVCNIGEDIVLVNIDLKDCLKKCDIKDRFCDNFF